MTARHRLLESHLARLAPWLSVRRTLGRLFCDHKLRWAGGYDKGIPIHTLNNLTCAKCWRQQRVNDVCMDEIVGLMIEGQRQRE